jgi:adenine phosphoribosyltransferase
VPKTAATLPLSPDKVAWLKNKVRDIPDFPRPGIIFRDLTTLLGDREAFSFVMDALVEKYAPIQPDYIASIEARGFIFGAALAYALNIGFLPMRKPGKLPFKVEKIDYELEYGSDALEIHADALVDNTHALPALHSVPVMHADKNLYKKVVLIDDLLATGGTAMAAINLLTKVGANVVGVGFIIELLALSGRAKLSTKQDIFSLLQY